MRNYECMYILHPELSEEELNQHVEKFTSIITDQGGLVEKTDLWGRRRLAYEVKKLKEGYYVLVLFQGEPAAAQELERVFKITETVIRYLIVRLDDTDAVEE
ncbi:30S ribosomal protein S6 [Desulfitibacter alkalitolerans]|uniref:30S ribosomal protein S6 n=1 Tax=Desulfitibacter alkalitolerans TaxID=264641 RepID=UPI00047F25CF|nr:30S ribosomal protein S6 [Desulfitibacter alkalitolerans]